MKTNKQTNKQHFHLMYKVSLKILTIFALCICLTFCKKPDAAEGNQNITTEQCDNSQLFKLPLAAQDEFEAFKNDPGIISPTISWALCWSELKNENFFGRAEWASAKLHKNPVFIYGIDGRPRLYDFILVSPSGELVGTLTAYARKCSAIQIQNASTGIVNYEIAATKTIEKVRYYADRFSNRMYGEASDQSSSIASRPLHSMSTNNTSNDLTTAEMTDEELLEWMRYTFLPMALEDPAAVDIAYQKMYDRWLIEKAQREAAWNAIGDPADNIADTTNWNPITQSAPAETRIIISPTVKFNVDTDGGDLAWVREYQDMFKTYKYIGGMCGPWVAAYILTTNNYLVNGNHVDPRGGLFEVDKPMTAPMLHYSLVDNSEGKVSLNLNAVAVSDIYWRIREQAKSGVRLFWCNGQLHWTVLYGSWRVAGFLGIDFYYRFMNADNGSYVDWNNRKDRDPRNPDNYTQATWEQTFYEVNDNAKRLIHVAPWS